MTESETPTRKQLLIVSGIAMTILWVVLLVIDKDLEATGGPGILALEFAGSRERVVELMAEWGAHGTHLARLSLWIDFAFMAAYGAFFVLATRATRDFGQEHGLPALAKAGIVAPYLALGAALFDVLENTVWLLALGGHGGEPGPPFATACASIKFLCIALVILYCTWGLISRLRLRRQR
ncbi:MAG TPA: hypothetical protein VI039_00030 [Solirubrobacterales bacterium]